MRRHVEKIGATAINDAWQRRATAAAIEAARKIVTDGAIPAGTPIGRLGEGEWGWIVAAVLFGWIATRAEQAVAEEIDTELTVRMTSLDPDPWDVGVVVAILPELAEISVDWNLPLAQWSRENMVEFLLTTMRLIRKAAIARDLSDRGVTRQSGADIIAREANAAAGGPLLTPDEFSDEIGI
jgi:hypothetical protein